MTAGAVALATTPSVLSRAIARLEARLGSQLLQRFAARYPQVRIEFNISNRNVDLVAEGFDAVIRLGAPPDSGLVARKLEDAALRLVASPGYLARAGMPQCIADLAQHTCLPFVMPSSGRFAPWLLRGMAATWIGCPLRASKSATTCWPWSRWPNPAWASARATASSWMSASRVVR